MSKTVRKLPVGIQSFEKIRTCDNLYVDKTEYIYNLVHTDVPYFLSRPRRFGKSLLISTLKAYWEGKKELFAGLSIEKAEESHPEAWESYPVLHFDFNKADYLQDGALEAVLEAHLNEWEKLYGQTTKNAPLGVRFGQIMRLAYDTTGKRCVILVDEYDKPLIETMENEPLVARNKAVFKGFFSALKSEDDYIRFILITGVTKFNKVSIFSDLNQLEDISFDQTYAGICGITEEELTDSFMPEIEAMATDHNISTSDCLSRLRTTYDGYHFSPDGVGVYNPYSLFCALKKKRFASFWFETGTPTFLVKQLKQIDFDVRRFSDSTIQSTEALLSDYRGDNPDPVPLLYQTGYLTIKDCSDGEVYTLGFPNEEVSYAFLQSLMPEYVSEYGAGTGKDVFALKRYIETGDTDGIKNMLTALFAGISYSNTSTPFEHYFQTIIYIIFTLLGKYTICELHTSEGRIDCVVETRKFVYLFEFKRDKTADEALNQIADNHYSDVYAADPRKVFKIGVNFDSDKRQMSEWKVTE